MPALANARAPARPFALATLLGRSAITLDGSGTSLLARAAAAPATGAAGSKNMDAVTHLVFTHPEDSSWPVSWATAASVTEIAVAIELMEPLNSSADGAAAPPREARRFGSGSHSMPALATLARCGTADLRQRAPNGCTRPSCTGCRGS